MKRVTKGELIAEPGYFYTPEEHKKVEKQLKVLDHIEALCAPKPEAEPAKPLGVRA